MDKNKLAETHREEELPPEGFVFFMCVMASVGLLTVLAGMVLTTYAALNLIF